MTHLLNRGKDGLFINGCAAFRTQTGQCLLVFPQGHGWIRHCSIGNLQIPAFFWVQHPNATDVTRITSDKEDVPLVSLSDPGLQGVAKIPNVVDHESLPMDVTSENGEKVQQERFKITDRLGLTRGAHSLFPPCKRSFANPSMKRFVVRAGNSQREPFFEFG